jgi:Phosphatidylinositol 3- and 4-kinase
MNLSSQFAEIPDFKFDRKSGRYRHKSGRYAARTEVMRLMRENILVQREDLIALADRVEAKQITLTEFQIESAQLLKRIHVQSAVLGKDGIDNMTPQDWLEVARELKRQYYAGKDEATGRRFGLKYLAQSLRDGLLSQPQLKNALRMFANSARTAFHRASLALEQVKGKAFGVRIRTKSESCASCIRYAALPPQQIGRLVLPTQKCECGTNCGCYIQALTLEDAIARGMPANFAESGGIRKDANGQWRDAQGQFADPPASSGASSNVLPSQADFQKADLVSRESQEARPSMNAAGLYRAEIDGAAYFVKANLPISDDFSPWDSVDRETLESQLVAEVATKEIADLVGLGEYYLPVQAYDHPEIGSAIVAPYLKGETIAAALEQKNEEQGWEDEIEMEDYLKELIQPQTCSKLLALDYALGALDRHEGNVMLAEGKVYMIDNGLSFAKPPADPTQKGMRHRSWTNTRSVLRYGVRSSDSPAAAAKDIIANKDRIIELAKSRKLNTDGIEARISHLATMERWADII